MKPKTKFLKMFYKLPERARRELVLNAYGDNPMSLSVICIEVRGDTELGKLCLCALGYIETEDDVNVALDDEPENITGKAIDERWGK